MARTWWAWARLAGGAAILLGLLRTLGTGPFAAGVRPLDVRSLAAATAIAAVTTVCCAWRWSLVARGLGVAIPLPAAVAAYYRSQFVNTVLPGGVLGDLHRGMAHGRSAGDVSRGLRAVGWERLAGQLVQVVLAAAVLLTFPSPVRPLLPAVGPVLVALSAAGLVLVTLVVAAARRPSRPGSGQQRLRADLRGLLDHRAWPGVVAASVVVVAGHALTFLIAARAAGVPAAPARLLPLALLALLAMAVPVNVGGWGPREGVTAWAFGAAGLGADQGLATAVAYGALAVVANLPGAVLLTAGWLTRRRSVSGPRSLDDQAGSGSVSDAMAPDRPAPEDRAAQGLPVLARRGGTGG